MKRFFAVLMAVLFLGTTVAVMAQDSTPVAAAPAAAAPAATPMPMKKKHHHKKMAPVATPVVTPAA
jgi:hypothetical protein